MSLSQIELVWVTVRVEGECLWVNLREENKVSESNMAEFKMAAIIKLSQNEWVKFFCANGWTQWMSEVFFVQMVGTNLGKCEWVWEEKLRWLNLRWWNLRWQNSRWLPSSSWVRMNEFESDWISLSQSFVQNGWIQDGCHHQVYQIELVWVRVRMERECFWVNLREENKVSESTMAESKMAAIIKLSQNEWVKFYVQMVGTNEWVKFFCANGGNQFWQVWVSLRGKTKMAEFKMVEFKMAEFKMATIIKLSENEWVWVRLN